MRSYQVDAQSINCRQASRCGGPVSNHTLLLEFNADLNCKAYPWILHEPFLEAQLLRLDALDSIPEKGYWLSLARLTELALLCAGHYADHNELEAAGDLLVNPSRILVHLPNRAEPVLKERHTPLTDQFAACAETRAGVMQWLKHRTVLEVQQQPLLPRLSSRLGESGMVRKSYLNSVTSRMQRIAELIGVLAAWHIPKNVSLYEYLLRTGQRDRDFVESRLCRFDTLSFERLGEELEQLLEGRIFPSEFLVDTSYV